MARISNEEFALSAMPDGEVLDLDAPVRESVNPLDRINPDVIALVEGAYKLGKFRVKILSGYADKAAALADGAKVARQAKKYGEVRPAGRITVAATVVENFTHPNMPGRTIPFVVTLTAKDYVPRERKSAEGAPNTVETPAKPARKTTK